MSPVHLYVIAAIALFSTGHWIGACCCLAFPVLFIVADALDDSPMARINRALGR